MHFMEKMTQKLEGKHIFSTCLSNGESDFLFTDKLRADSEYTKKLRDLGVAGSVMARLELAGIVNTPLAESEFEQPSYTGATLLMVVPDSAGSSRGFLVVNAEILDSDTDSLDDNLDMFAAYLEPDEEITVGRRHAVLGLSSSGIPSNISRSHLVIKNSSNEPFQLTGKGFDQHAVGTPRGKTAIAITDTSTLGTILYA